LKFPFAKTIMTGEKQSRTMMYTKILSLISLRATSSHRNVSTCADYKCVTIITEDTRKSAKTRQAPNPDSCQEAEDCLYRESL
jgi:hypothetical protein